MEISDIQELPNGNLELTFACGPDYDDFMKLTLTKDNMWTIHKYCGDHLSYAAQLKNDKK